MNVLANVSLGTLLIRKELLILLPRLIVLFWFGEIELNVQNRLSLVAASGGPLFIAVRGPLTIAASLVGGAQAPDAQAQ